MVKIYPENIPKKNDDIVYDLMCSVICGLIFCIFMCVGLIVLLVLLIEKDKKDGSNIL
tara:strand:- start:425 stop:598 length:174 start_codon:yes stop_codon:yes gene_type:complete